MGRERVVSPWAYLPLILWRNKTFLDILPDFIFFFVLRNHFKFHSTSANLNVSRHGSQCALAAMENTRTLGCADSCKSRGVVSPMTASGHCVQLWATQHKMHGEGGGSSVGHHQDPGFSRGIDRDSPSYWIVLWSYTALVWFWWMPAMYIRQSLEVFLRMTHFSLS